VKPRPRTPMTMEHQCGSDAARTTTPGEWFRVIATMNVRDKATLFRLSYALLRRFAIIEVPAPDDPTLRAIARADAQRVGIDVQFADLAATVFMRADGLGRIVELGGSDDARRSLLREAAQSLGARDRGRRRAVRSPAAGWARGERGPRRRGTSSQRSSAPTRPRATPSSCGSTRTSPHVRFDA
jgi:hypothetical protein